MNQPPNTSDAAEQYPAAENKRLRAENAALKQVLNEAMLTSGRFHAACMECGIASSSAGLPDPETVARDLQDQKNKAANLQVQLEQALGAHEKLQNRPAIKLALWFDQIRPLRNRWIRSLYEGCLLFFLRLVTFRRHPR